MIEPVRLAPGTRLGPYQVVAALGKGGMGEVYRALDTRLDRQVAIKVLPGDVASSTEARQRFEREAKSISKLSHRHICALFDVGREGDIEYLVMELLDGRTLADELAAGQMPWSEVVGVGTQIAQALAAAHGRGIIHRDLKPGNVMLTRGGAKLLDFGLAKPNIPVFKTDSPDEAATASVAEPLTEKGRLLGTAAYMSPEQLQGQPADARSDVFALGLILFQMATGRRAFTGDTLIAAASETLHATAPTLSSLRADVPPAFERLVQACLVKEPDARWQSAHDAALELAAIGGDRGPHPRTPNPMPRRSVLVPWLVAGTALALTAAMWITRATPGPTPNPLPITLELLPPPGAKFTYSVETVHFAVSPDGGNLAFIAVGGAGKPQVWIRPLASLTAKSIPGTDGASSVFWSPDGRSIGFFAGRSLKRLDLSSGTPVEITTVSPGGGYSATWGADVILFSTIEGQSLNSVPIGGGDVVSVAKPDLGAGWSAINFPLFLPDGRSFLCVQRRTDGTKKLMVGEPGKALREVMPVESNVQYFAPDVVVYAQGGTLVGRAFDLKTLQATGEPFSVADSVSFFLTSGTAAFSASSSGTLVYQAHRNVTRLAWLDRTGKELGRVGTPGAFLDVRTNVDGRTALFTRGLPQTGTYDVWWLDLERNVETRVTLNDRTTEISPVLFADGKTLFFSKAVGRAPRLTRKLLGSDDEQLLAPGTGLQAPTDISPDGQWLAYYQRSDRGDYDIWLMPLEGGGAPRALQHSVFMETDLRFSPDGQLYSFLSDESGTVELYVAPTAGGPKAAVSSGGAVRARWSPDGRELLYHSRDLRMISVPVLSGPAVRLGAPTTLFAVGVRPWQDFSISTDGRRLLAAIPEVVAVEEPLTAVINWRRPGG